MKTIVHVNRHNIAWNNTHEDKRPVFTAKDYTQNRRGFRVNILSEYGDVVGSFVYRPDKPLSCGAKAWFETNLNVEVTDE